MFLQAEMGQGTETGVKHYSGTPITQCCCRPRSDGVLVAVLLGAALHDDGGALPLRPQLPLGQHGKRRPCRRPLACAHRRRRAIVSAVQYMQKLFF